MPMTSIAFPVRFVLERPAAAAKRQLYGRLAKAAVGFGLVVVFGTIFASLEAIEICSATVKANFCP
jgi:hypothetical protein